MPEKIKRGDTKLALKAGFWYVVSNFLVKAIAFITTPIFARLMSKADYGEFSNFASWQSTLLIITGAELYSTLSRAYYDYPGDYDSYISSVTILSFGITAVFYGLFLAFGSIFYRVVAIPEEYVHILFAVLLFQSCKEIFMARERTLYRYKSVAMMSAVNMVVPTLAAVIAVILSAEGKQLGARIYGFYVPSALVGACCAIPIFAKARTAKLAHFRYALKLSLPLMVHYLTVYLLTATNTIVTKNVLGAEEAAVVSVTTSTIHILTILMQAVSGAVTTWLMDNMEQKKYAELRRNLVFYVAGICVVALGVILVGPEIIWILGGTKYSSAVNLLPGMVVGVAIQSITTVFTIILTYEKHVVGTAVFAAVVSCLSVAAKVILLPRYGLGVLPAISMISFAVLFLCDYFLVRRAESSNIINMKAFSGGILLLVLVLFTCNFLYSERVLRYLIVAVLGMTAFIFAYKNRSILLSLLKKRK